MKTFLNFTRSIVGATALTFLAAGALPAAVDATTGPGGKRPAEERGTESAIARLSPTKGNNVRGTVRFMPEAKGVRVIAEIENLTPGEHGFHVHEKGDCSAPDASSAGGHFNPTGAPHAAREAEKRHVGDMGNITADQSGRATLNYVDEHLALTGPNSIIGKGVIVHAGRDDLKSQPSGDAGGRVACGVIERQ